MFSNIVSFTSFLFTIVVLEVIFVFPFLVTLYPDPSNSSITSSNIELSPVAFSTSTFMSFLDVSITNYNNLYLYLIAFIVTFVVTLVSLKLFIKKYTSKHNLYFSFYLICLSLIVIYIYYLS